MKKRDLTGGVKPALSFGAMLRAARLRAGLTQMSVADAVGISDAFLSQIERGVRRPASPTMYDLVAAVSAGRDESDRMAAAHLGESPSVRFDLYGRPPEVALALTELQWLIETGRFGAGEAKRLTRLVGDIKRARK